ncbi:4-alpha-glucanotransferase [Candidatus Aerophobetes bacterium]|uniref:4-alpha-glucanotransferase n=1 Tax=Aerophobetes bacterium TaxID=2030807 RepID=A0A2A4X7G8_UNCAE|nr:MAG: 4-alpha-glucanotransferase [Candidatus Aerophobetes bacterium]
MKNFDLVEHLKTTPLYPVWKNIGIGHHHGIQLLLSSIYSKKSIMIGDYFDLIPMIEWCKKIGFSFIQLLPIQDTGDMTSPYSALSSLALHPIYINLTALPYLNASFLKDLNLLKEQKSEKKIHFRNIYNQKIQFLHRYFDQTKKQHLQDKDFLSFIKENPWLNNYALYKTFSENFQSNIWESWPILYQNPSEDQLKQWTLEYKEQNLFHMFCQYICFSQMKKVKAIGKKMGVMLKGDVPILISPYSTDVWSERHYFNVDQEAGSKPSHDDPKGQKWGFPGFNWPAHIKDDFMWWKRRLSIANNFFSLYRIDHFIGLFRLWLIDHGEKPCDGHFSPKSEAEMQTQGNVIVSHIIASSSMLPIAEVMGRPPSFIKQSLFKAGIPFLKITRYPKKEEGPPEFTPLTGFNPLSIATVSTHDIYPLRLWWGKNKTLAAAFAKARGQPYKEQFTAQMQYVFLRNCHQSSSLFHANLLLEYLAMVPSLSWENPEDDIINTPGTENSSNWSYKHKTDIESIVECGVLCEKMKALL